MLAVWATDGYSAGHMPQLQVVLATTTGCVLAGEIRAPATMLIGANGLQLGTILRHMEIRRWLDCVFGEDDDGHRRSTVSVAINLSGIIAT